MKSFWRFCSRIFFWSFERGSWQYDVAVVAIVLFVLVTPTRWFHDQPLVAVPAAAEQVELLSNSGDAQVYRVDALVLATREKTPALENDLHNTLQKSQADLSSGRFSIVKIEPERDAQGTVIAYRVEIHR